ncbi:PH domain-containing protein [Sporolactobacillus terrae]|uniref:PH domain-containing protein n=1 Tax=Sporolactobacillus terrae TaxID=269673 RepID=UPI001119EFA4|nr:PH domain-containing protein [Sporolactobacillus terrae]
MNSKRRHLHFFAIFSDALSTLWSIIVPFGFGLVWGLRHLDDIIGYVLILPLVILIFNFVKWLRYTYEWSDDQIHIRSGIFVRNDCYIRFQRIQSVQIKTNLLLRLLGVVQLKFDTADPASKGDRVLTALNKKEAERIKAEVSRVKGQLSNLRTEGTAPESPVHKEKQPKKRYQLSGKRLLAASLLSSKIGAMLAAVFGLWSQADDLIPDNIRGRSLSYLEHASLVGLIILIGAAILLLWVASLISILLRWGFFRLMVFDTEWRIHRGVWETKDETYKTDRVQAIQIQETWLQQLFGWCTIYAQCSGSIDSENDDGGSIIVFPMLRKEELPGFLSTVIPRFAGTLSTRVLPLRSTLYRMAGPACFWIVSCSILAWRFDWGNYALIGLPFILIYGWFRRRSESWALSDKRLIVVNRWFAKTTTITRRNNIQSLTIKQSFLQKRLGLANTLATIRASSEQIFSIHQLEKEHANTIFQWFRNRN